MAFLFLSVDNNVYLYGRRNKSLTKAQKLSGHIYFVLKIFVVVTTIDCSKKSFIKKFKRVL